MSKEWDTPVFFEGLFTEGVKEEAQKPVSEIMSPVKESVAPDESIIKAVYLMIEKKLSIVPVIEKGVVKGVVRLQEIFNELAALVMAD